MCLPIDRSGLGRAHALQSPQPHTSEQTDDQIVAEQWGELG
jgi:hypothetical protein